MSKNLVELVRRHHGESAPTALEVLKEALERNGEMTDDDRRASPPSDPACPRPSSTASPPSTTTCRSRAARATSAPAPARRAWAAGFDAHVGRARARARRAARASARTTARSRSGRRSASASATRAPAVRDGDVVDAGPGAVARVLAGERAQAAEPEVRSMLDEPVLLRPGDFSGLRAALAGYAGAVARSRSRRRTCAAAAARASRPARSGTSPAARRAGREVVVVNGDEGDPGSYIDKVPAGAQPGARARGRGARRLRGRRGARVRLRALRVPASRSRPLEAAIAAARDAGQLGDDIAGSGFSFDVSVVEGAGSYVVGEETALLASLEGLSRHGVGAPAVPGRARLRGLPTVVNNVETLANVPVDRAARRRRVPPRPRPPGTKLVCLNERFARPGVVRGAARHAAARDLRGTRRRHARRARDEGAADRRPARRDPARRAARHAVRLRAARGRGLHARPRRRSSPSTTGPTCARSPGTCSPSARTRAAASASPAAIGLQRGLEMVAAPTRAVDRAPLEELLETLEVASLCAHGGGMPAPIRSLLAHFPEELGLR